MIDSKKKITAKNGWLALGLMAAVLAGLFWRSFLFDYVHFSNDGPLGSQSVAWLKLPSAICGMWDDLNDTGFEAGALAPNFSTTLKLLGAVGYAKFYAPIALFIVGLGAWSFFRQLKFSPLAAILGALAAMLNSNFFARSCWGVASQQIALGMDFLALALIIANTHETPGSIRWARLALAGLCVGMNVMEAADIGAIHSLIIAGFVFYKSLADAEKSHFISALRGASHVAVVAVFAGFIAYQTIISLVGTQIQGIAGTAQDTETKAQHWDWATQWSLPKKETLGLIIPGLFGYKMDTPNNMMPAVQQAYEGGAYWGGQGRDPGLDRFLDAGGQGTPPSGFMRFTGGGNYCGILVALIAAWAIAQSFRRRDSLFTNDQKKIIWFWTVVLVFSLVMAWGRFAPIFYGLLYQLPYFSTIRNPDKFLIFLSWAVVILFAYGVDALSRRHLDRAAPKSFNLVTQLQSWWAKAGAFDRKWILTCGGVFGAGVLGWLIYSSRKKNLVQYLQAMGFPDAEQARQIASFSLSQTAWGLALFAFAIGLVAAVIAGYFNGPRAKIGGLLLGGFLIFDLVRADLPYIIHWDYKQKYEVGTLNPVVDFLREKPYEHRVAGLPFRTPQGMELLDQVYRIEWMQHLFLYYNIQCLDLIQMSRMPEDLKAYYEALTPRGTPESAPLLARHWELTDTRYLLGPAGYLEVLNQQLDPVKNRFRIAQRFEIVPKPGILQPTRLEELTAVLQNEGKFALFEFTGALPRAKLYSNWQVNTNDQANLKTLADLSFDPAKTVLISTPQKNLAAVSTHENSGTVEFKSYSPKHLAFAVNATAPSVLLLNDKYDPNWRVTIDGQRADLLRCNFLMRGVQVPAGAHTVEFYFSLPNKPLYVTLSAMGLGIALCGFLFLASRRNPKRTAK